MKAYLTAWFFLGGVFLPVTAKADIKLNAPGQSGQTVQYLTVNDVPFESHNKAENQVLIPVYKFVFRGIEAEINTTGGSTLNLQAMVQYEGQPNTKQRIDLDLKKKNGSSTIFVGTTLLSNPIVFNGANGPVNIVISWVGSGNANKPAGFFNIIGEYLPTPPKPTGSLSGLPALIAKSGNTAPKVSGSATVNW